MCVCIDVHEKYIVFGHICVGVMHGRCFSAEMIIRTICDNFSKMNHRQRRASESKEEERNDLESD